MHQTVDLILQALALVAASAFSLYQARNLLSGARSQLKTDLEILKLLESAHPMRATIEANVERTLTRVYAQKAPGPQWRTALRSPDFLSGTAIAVVFAALTAYLLRDVFTWWAVVTGLVVFAGIGGIVTAFEKSAGQKKNPGA